MRVASFDRFMRTGHSYKTAQMLPVGHAIWITFSDESKEVLKPTLGRYLKIILICLFYAEITDQKKIKLELSFLRGLRIFSILRPKMAYQ
jgi:hypothetical protein